MEYLQSLWESFEAFRDAIITDRVAQRLYGLHFSVWIIIAVMLGALTLWTYWRCFVEVRRRELETEARESVLRALSPDPGSDPDALDPTGEAHNLRFRNWALETRLRSALEAARSGDPLDAEALADGLDDILNGDASAAEDGAPAEAISALKYRNWRLETRVAQLEDQYSAAEAPSEEIDFEAQETIAALTARSDRLQGWLRRLISSAKSGDLSAVAEIEAEMGEEGLGAAEGDPAGDADLLRRIERLEAEKATLEDDASTLRYRRWLLSRRLGDAVEAARGGSALEIEALLADLARDGEEPRFGEAGANAFMGGAQIPGMDAANRATDSAQKAEQEAEIASLRARLAAQEAEFGRLRSRAATAPRMGAADASESASLRYRLWLSQAELRRERAAKADAAAPARPIEAEPPRRPAPLRSAEPQRAADVGPQMAARARVATLVSRLWVAERRLEARRAQSTGLSQRLDAETGELRARLAQAEAAAARAETLGVQALRKREEEAETLKARLTLAQAEAERLKGELEKINLLPKTRDAGPAFAAMRAAQASGAESFALGSGAASLKPRPQQSDAQGGGGADRAVQRAKGPLEPAVSPASFSDATELDESHLAARAALAQAIASPRRGVEDAARELIESGSVVAVGSNRPQSLRDAPGAETPDDDLTLIAGVSAALESKMNRLGLRHFRQIAEFAPRELAWLDDMLQLNGAVVRDRWLPQAELLANMRREGRLTLDDTGKYGRLSAKAAAGSGGGALAAAAREETIDSLPRHPDSVDIAFPLTGAETAALDILTSPGEADAPREVPASFSRQPFAEDDDLDDLKAIRGVGPKLEAALRTLGVGRYRQLAVLSPLEAAWLDRRLGLGGRVVQDRWLPQAEALAARSEDRRRMAEEGAPAQYSATSAPAAPAAAAPLRPMVTPAPGGAQAEAEQPPSGDGLSPAEREALRLIEAGRGAQQPRPSGLLAQPSGGAPDELRRINGVNGILEELLNDLGVFYFRQLAAFSAADLAWLDSKLSFRGRVARDRWASQAAALSQNQG